MKTPRLFDVEELTTKEAILLEAIMEIDEALHDLLGLPYVRDTHAGSIVRGIRHQLDTIREVAGNADI